ncbi:hypothetical protein ACIRCZ_13235 [Leifsonia sp. NPDC102414]|uniref:hypothetical protein n=1 Tax=Leifsonia sp. NPDC102414 TaxID=3364124 RepID=UPI0038227A51
MSENEKRRSGRRRIGGWRPAAAVLIGMLVAVSVPTTATAIGSWSTPSLVYTPTSVQTTGYSYAPDLIPGTTNRMWSCHSRTSGTVRDDIFETKLNGATLVSSASVLSGTGTGWDSFHNCDPSVVAVNATIAGTAFSYAMFYTGNDADCSCHNQIGVAFATSLDGPWTKYPSPVIAFDPAQPTTQWGAGQPSATSVDPAAGTVVLTWTSGYTSTPSDSKGNFAQISFATGAPVVSSRHQIQTTGLTDSTGAADYLNNFDIAYSPTRDVFFLIREAHPYPTSNPNYISSSVQVDSISGSAMWSGTGNWTVLSSIGSGVTGYARTHNPGFARTVYGTLPDESKLTALVTTSTLDPNSLWSYRVWSTTATL